MDKKGDEKGLGIHRLWLHSFTPNVQGGLRGDMNQYSDPSGNILTPKKQPVTERRKDGFKVIPVDPEVEPPTACIPPASSATVSQTGGSTPLGLGENITVEQNGSVGITEPVTYQWYLNGTPTVNTETYPYTVSDGDIMNRDSGGLGSIQFYVSVVNACGAAVYAGGFAAQGTPPPP